MLSGEGKVSSFIVGNAVHIASHCKILQWVDCMDRGGVCNSITSISRGGGNQDGKWIFFNMFNVYGDDLSFYMYRLNSKLFSSCNKSIDNM